MRTSHLLSLSLALAFSMGAFGCGKDKQAKASEEDEEVLVCEETADCEDGWVCLDGECANSASGAIYTDPANAVTPDKVKREVENIQKNAQKRNDKILEGL